MQYDDPAIGDRRSIDSGLRKFMMSILIGFVLQAGAILFYAGAKANDIENNKKSVYDNGKKLETVEGFAKGVALNARSVEALAENQKRILKSLETIGRHQHRIEVKLERHLGNGH